MSILAGLWQRPDQAIVYDVIAMKDNEESDHFSICSLQTRFYWRRSHSILHPQGLSKLIDIFHILFQTRGKMYLVPSLNSSTMTMCRLCALIFALSRSGTGTGGGDIEPGIVVLVCLFQTGPQRGDVRFICETWLFLVSWQYIWSRKKCQDGFCRGT